LASHGINRHLFYARLRNVDDEDHRKNYDIRRPKRTWKILEDCRRADQASPLQNLCVSGTHRKKIRARLRRRERSLSNSQTIGRRNRREAHLIAAHAAGSNSISNVAPRLAPQIRSIRCADRGQVLIQQCMLDLVRHQKQRHRQRKLDQLRFHPLQRTLLSSLRIENPKASRMLNQAQPQHPL
jgi:hypothetical protein